MKKVGIFLTVIGVLLGGLAGLVVFVVSNSNKMFDNIYIEYTGSPIGAKNAIVIYQPGITSFSQEVATDIAKGLNDNGYNVVLTTPNEGLAKDLSEYQKVIFGTPIYMGKHSEAITRYVTTIENYGDAEIYFYSVGMLETTEEFPAMEKLFERKNLIEVVKISKSMCLEDQQYAYNYGCKLATK